MFARIKKSGNRQYLQIVESRREKGKVFQRVIGTIGRMDKLKTKSDIDKLVYSLARYSEKVLLILSGKSDVSAMSRKIGPSLIFERLWEELGIKKVIKSLLTDRKFEFDVERAIYLTVLHRLFISGSDRHCDKWRRDYLIEGIEGLSLHQVYRAMAWIGEPLVGQEKARALAPRCIKDKIEEGIFFEQRNLFTSLDIVFFDTTSIYFEGEGGQNIGKRGNSKDQRPDLKQMIIGVVLDDKGRPLCCELWPGNTADVKTLIPVTDRIRSRFGIGQFCVVADRGMISKDTVEKLEDPQRNIFYILGAKLRKVKEVREEVLSRAGRYKEVYPDNRNKKDSSPLKVKEVVVGKRRYIVCLNEGEARKDAADREAIVASLRGKLEEDVKGLIGNKGYRKYLKVERSSVNIDFDKVRAEERFDGKWVLQTNTNLSAEEVALKYKQLWEVEHAFRNMKSILETRPVFHQCDDSIRGHVFCSFLALVLHKELFHRLEGAGNSFEWSDIKQDLKALQETIIEEGGKTLAIRSECLGTTGKVFQAVGVGIPPTIREL